METYDRSVASSGAIIVSMDHDEYDNSQIRLNSVIIETCDTLPKDAAATAKGVMSESMVVTDDTNRDNDNNATTTTLEGKKSLLSQTESTEISAIDVELARATLSANTTSSISPPTLSVADAETINDDNDIDTDALTGNEDPAPISVPSSEPIATDSSSVATSNTITEQQQTESYVNHGLAAWEINRQKWLQQRRQPLSTEGEEVTVADQISPNHHHAKQINVDEIIDAIFTSHKKMLLSGSTANNTATSSTATAPFPQSVPLPQLIDILQDLWEAESLS